MTRNDYELLAGALKQAKPDKLPGITDTEYNNRLIGWRWAVVKVADTAAAQNARFNRDKFYLACGA